MGVVGRQWNRDGTQTDAAPEASIVPQPKVDVLIDQLDNPGGSPRQGWPGRCRDLEALGSLGCHMRSRSTQPRQAAGNLTSHGALRTAEDIGDSLVGLILEESEGDRCSLS